MDIGLNNPLTILTFVVFIFGSQLWLIWIRHYMVLEDTLPERAVVRAENLTRVENMVCLL
jgi:hypothetical protein